jgi:chemotaxis protein histidine kinase CheA
MQAMQMQDSEIDATVKTADDMWAVYQSKQKDPAWTKKNVTEKIGHFQTLGYGDFITKYAVPTRYMLMYGEYSHKAFLNFLVRLRTVGYRSKDEWVDRQADYVKMLWRVYNPRAGAKEAGEAWLQARDNVKKEMDGFETDYEKAKLKAEERRKAAMDAQRATLLALLADRTVAARVAEHQAKDEEEAARRVRFEEDQTQEVETDTKEQSPATPLTEVEPEQQNEPVTLTASQRKNAARRRKEKACREAAAAELAEAEAEQARVRQRRADKERVREDRRKQREREKIMAREAEKDRMRKRWEEAHAKSCGEKTDDQLVEEAMLDVPDAIEGLPSGEDDECEN